MRYALLLLVLFVTLAASAQEALIDPGPSPVVVVQPAAPSVGIDWVQLLVALAGVITAIGIAAERIRRAGDRQTAATEANTKAVEQVGAETKGVRVETKALRMAATGNTGAMPVQTPPNTEADE